MRGKDNACQIILSHFRITPAYAGKSWNEQAAKCAERDHPRLCGEKAAVPDFSGRQKGSPPPMRGKVQSTEIVQGTTRITPAYAGKRFNFLSTSFGMGDHPRLCGEKAIAVFVLV